METPVPLRKVLRTLRGQETSDGAGVRLTRIIGTAGLESFDPFLLLDAFRSDNPDDYIGGFPSHPHRGFETVTYLLAGRMRHRDNAGHAGVIEAGGVQWMTAGHGIIHSEMPEQADGLLFGFQLWVNLPAAHKMDPPRYQELARGDIPVFRQEGATVRVIAGTDARGTQGPVRDLNTPVHYFDIELEANASLLEPLPSEHNAFAYLISGAAHIGDALLESETLALLGEGSAVRIDNGPAPSRLLLLSGKPLNEPVARYGPFVMNTHAEIEQTLADYRAGRLGPPAE